jgi:hypothetical protein
MEHEHEHDRERDRSRRFGFVSLLVWMSLGFGLEGAHALKLSAYLDHPLRRELLVWAHAHGVGLALVVLAYAASGVSAGSARAGQALRAASVIMPAGFALGVLGHGEADPGPSIWLVPVGALLAIGALISVVRALPRR